MMMARTAVHAAGGIVLRHGEPPLIAVVRPRKRNEWVLPKGKLDDGETSRDAARRETGHDVAVHEFLGTLAYQSGGRLKVVHFWRMEASGAPVAELMRDIKAVDWLPLEHAVERLSREYERAFLANVGPLALEAAAVMPLERGNETPLADEVDGSDAATQMLPAVERYSVPEPRDGLLQRVTGWLRSKL